MHCQNDESITGGFLEKPQIILTIFRKWDLFKRSFWFRMVQKCAIVRFFLTNMKINLWKFRNFKHHRFFYLDFSHQFSNMVLAYPYILVDPKKHDLNLDHLLEHTARSFQYDISTSILPGGQNFIKI